MEQEAATTHTGRKEKKKGERRFRVAECNTVWSSCDEPLNTDRCPNIQQLQTFKAACNNGINFPASLTQTEQRSGAAARTASA